MNNIITSTINKANCCGCSSCVHSCPAKCIKMNYDEEGFLYPHVDEHQCIDCGKCRAVCPIINQGTKGIKPILYGCQSNNEIRMSSSSGGAFYVLAKHVIDNNGIVFGAKFDKDWNVVHDCTTQENGIRDFQTSKYVQSNIQDCFPKIKDSLDVGKIVLFSGTPCQIAGLKQYLKKEYDNLITIDLVCHGVPSPGVWKKYLQEFCNNYNDKTASISRINFRNKNGSWKNYSLSISYFLKGNNRDFIDNIYQNPYMRLFLDNVTLRPSCYECRFRNLSSGSDVTLGDLWGVDKIVENVTDDIGTSLVILNTQKGKSLFEKLSFERLFPVEYDDVVKYNVAMIKSYEINKFRTKFFILNKYFSLSRLFKYYKGQANIGERILFRILMLLHS